MKKLMSILLIAACLSITSYASANRASAPALKGRNLQGKNIRLSKFEGKVVVVSFWATWCVPCKRELDDLEKIYAKRKDRLIVLAIATDGPETYSQIRGVVKRHRWSFHVIPDKEGAITSVFNPRGTVPYSVYIDRHGRLAYDHEGYAQGDAQVMTLKIDDLLRE